MACEPLSHTAALLAIVGSIEFCQKVDPSQLESFVRRDNEQTESARLLSLRIAAMPLNTPAVPASHPLHHAQRVDPDLRSPAATNNGRYQIIKELNRASMRRLLYICLLQCLPCRHVEFKCRVPAMHRKKNCPTQHSTNGRRSLTSSVLECLQVGARLLYSMRWIHTRSGT